MIVKDYGIPICRILNTWQVLLYLSHSLKPIDMYVSQNSNGEYKIVYVFDKVKSGALFARFREHELDIGEDVTVV